MPREAATIDLRDAGPMAHLAGTLETLFSDGTRTLRIVGAGDGEDSLVEVLMPEAPETPEHAGALSAALPDQEREE